MRGGMKQDTVIIRSVHGHVLPITEVYGPLVAR